MSKSLFRASGVVAVMTLLSHILGFVREIMLAAAFGAGAGMDAFLVALMIPNLGWRMFAEGAFSQAFVPVFNETKKSEEHTSELQSLMRISYAVFRLKNKQTIKQTNNT